MNEEGIEA